MENISLENLSRHFRCYGSCKNCGGGGERYQISFIYRTYVFLNLFTVLDSRTTEGKLFHSFALLTEKKFLRRSSFARGTTSGMNEF